MSEEKWHLIHEDEEKYIYADKVLFHHDGSDLNEGTIKTVYKNPRELFDYGRDFVRPFLDFVEHKR